MERIGRYEIQGELGRGSMGVVYLARDPRVGRLVALKTHNLPEGLSRDEKQEYKERFLREAQAAGALSHPAIVTIHDADEDSRGIPYIAMEYVAGRSLKEVLSARGALDFKSALEMAGTLAGALGAAHSAGVIHRDIKPANILVSEKDGAFKLTDFGVARLSCSELTRSGLTPGSPVYMSPEQITGKGVDGRSDLFSLAVVLYLSLSGKKPFEGEDLSALAYAVAHETPVPISRLVPGLPAGMDEFMDRALAKSPEDRFADGDRFREALNRLRVGGDDGTVAEEDGTIPAARIVPIGKGRIWSDRARWALSGKRRIVVGAFLLVGLLLAWTAWSQARQASVILEGTSSFEDAMLTVLVDGEEVFTRELIAERKSAKVFGKELFKYGKETFKTRFDLPPGRHEMVARVVNEDDGRSFEDRLTVKLKTGETARFELTARPNMNTGVTLEPE